MNIDEIRNNIANKYNVQESLKRPAHITLYNPVKLSSKEQELQFFQALEQAIYFKSFSQVLKNFSAFPPHTIFIDVQHSDGIINLQAEIKKVLKPLALLPTKDNFKFHPHVTIAFKDIKANVFPEIMDEYKTKSLNGNF